MEKSQKETLMWIRDNLLKTLNQEEIIMEEFEKLIRYLVDNEDILNILSEEYKMEEQWACESLCRCIFEIFENEIEDKSYKIFPVFLKYDIYEGDIEEYKGALGCFEETCLWAFSTNIILEEKKGLSDAVKCFRSYIDYIVDLEDQSLIDKVDSFIRSIIDLIYDIIME